MDLYYVRADTPDGEDQSLLVEADTSTGAIEFWRIEYELDDDEMPEYAGKVPLTGKPGAIPWERIIPKFT